ncbi:MAG TPA: hypothetical protein VE591_07790 [Candidatus Acidoferrum sp.]|nr:hypothetical protein [Candidatus Acidoferrum sp.]
MSVIANAYVPAAVWEWIEGSRSFDEAWGIATAALCLALAVPILWWWLPEHRRSFFGTAIDRRYRLQLGYGIFCMAMAGTNIGCRFIPHGELPYVHPAFLLITLALVAGLGPRVVVLALASRQRTTAS